MPDKIDLEYKFWLMVIDWLNQTVPIERTLTRIEYLRKHFINGHQCRYHHDSMNYIIDRINKSYITEKQANGTPQP